MPKLAEDYNYSEYGSSYTCNPKSQTTAKLYYYRKIEKQKYALNPKRKRKKNVAFSLFLCNRTCGAYGLYALRLR